MKTLTGYILGFLFLGAINLVGNASAAANLPANVFDHVPATDLPAAATKMIKQAKLGDRQTTTISVVKAALGAKPTAAAAIITAISRSLPEMAAVAAGTAGAQQPAQAATIAQAAAVAAPAEAGKIVELLCRVVPNDYRNIAVAVVRVAPASGKEILDAVCLAIPRLKSSVQLSLLAYGGNPAFVADILDQAGSIPQVKQASNTQSAVATPASLIGQAGPPRIPLSTTPGNNSLAASGLAPAGADTGAQVPVGGRTQVDP